MKLKCIAIDDERSALENIQIIFQQKIENAELVGVAQDIVEGIKLIKKHKPGFDLLDIIEEINFKFIFITAYDHYAMQAIKKSASDYILKPIDFTELQTAVNKIYNEREFKVNYEFKNKFSISSLEGIEFINIEDIIRLEANQSYCYVFIENRKPILVTKSMSELEHKLPSNIFFKCHRAHLINLTKVKKYHFTEGGSITLTDNIPIPISSAKKKEFLEILN